MQGRNQLVPTGALGVGVVDLTVLGSDVRDCTSWSHVDVWQHGDNDVLRVSAVHRHVQMLASTDPGHGTTVMSAVRLIDVRLLGAMVSLEKRSVRFGDGFRLGSSRRYAESVEHIGGPRAPGLN